MTLCPHGVVDASYHGTIMTAEEGEQFMWWAHEKSKLADGGKMKGLSIASSFTSSQKLSWINNLIVAAESEFDPATQQLRVTGYEWA
jgi:hypothetical protein